MPRFTTFDGLGIAYADFGDRSAFPVLCLPGLTRNHADFDCLQPHLLGFRLIAMTCRGRGDSEHDHDYRNYTVAVESRDALALLDHLEIGRAAVIGTSRGGLMAVHMASVAKQRLAGVLLNDIGPVLEMSGIMTILEYLGRQPAEPDLESLVETISSRVPGFRNVPRERWREETLRNVVETAEGLRINYDPRLREAVLATEVNTDDNWSLFRSLDGLPIALVRGANSGLLSADAAAKMRTMRPDMVFAEVPDRGHCPFLDEPESLAVIRTWLAACQNSDAQ
ncbi:MAG: alpha/beta hydrolase [Paracoccaceae bacterium]|nr:alpha/beta hydrolase [Paracoccaceae bacterium]MDE2914714.1 alpha/beta hydrolase [Paracoccaceae bacterium]